METPDHHGSSPSTEDSSKGKGSQADKHGARAYTEDTDNRRLWDPTSKYDSRYVSAQRCEAWYMLMVLLFTLLGFVTVGVGAADQILGWLGLTDTTVAIARRYEWLSLGGLLGGVVYSAKWLYHSIAKGLWHEDRKVWRYLSPWISLGTTVGVGALLIAGFMRSPVDASGATSAVTKGSSGSTYIGVGFLIGYFSDMFLAKMKEVTQVLFGESESRFKRMRNDDRPPQ